jgi:hypothetical protein
MTLSQLKDPAFASGLDASIDELAFAVHFVASLDQRILLEGPLHVAGQPEVEDSIDELAKRFAALQASAVLPIFEHLFSPVATRVLGSIGTAMVQFDGRMRVYTDAADAIDWPAFSEALHREQTNALLPTWQKLAAPGAPIQLVGGRGGPPG